MKYLFDYWKDFQKKLNRVKFVFLFFDYDGTLTPIVSKPELAILSYRTRHLLKKLINQNWSRVAVISGRSLRDVKKLVNLRGIIYAGNHGLELEGPGLKYVNKKALIFKKYQDAIYSQLVASLRAYSRIFIEHKGLTLSIHYRLEKNKNTLKKVFKVIDSTTSSYVRRKNLIITHGKKVVEIKPRISWNKGKIVLWLLKYLNRKESLRNVLPIYLGDDTTDEDAFRVLKKRGIGIFVGNPKKKSLAEFYLRNTAQVVDFVKKINYLK